MTPGAMNPLPVGTTVHERYRIVSVVGRGGLGTVYQVTDVLFGKQNVYALKELIDQSEGARRQFELESQWLQSLDHNHIPKVREHFEWAGRLYLVMDFVDGENLEQKLIRAGGGGLPERQLIHWILPICDALSYLHTRLPPILHRDVKPANIIVTPGGHPVLVDLGIAKEHLPGANQTLTFVRKAGTEGYAPPEQYASGGQTGPWSDVYGLGATLFHLLTGRIPPTAVERVALDKRLVRPRDINPMISPRADEAVYRALALRPAERFPSMLAFAEALAASDAPPLASRPPAPRTPVSPPPRTPVSPPPSGPSWASVPSRPSMLSPRTMAGAAGRPLGSAPPLTPPSPASAPSRASSPSPASSTRTGRMAGVERATGSHALHSSGEIDGAEQNSAESAAERGPHRQSRLGRRLVLTGGAICLLAVILGGGLVLLSALAPPDRSAPQATVNGYYAALIAQDYNRAWQFAAESRNDVGAQSSFVASLRSEDVQYGRVKSFTVVNVESDTAGHATVRVNVTRAGVPGAPDTTSSFTLVLSQFDGNTWLINSVTAG
jgi:serine/threonine protein kinase